jgi:hypothetical protein
MTERFWLLKWLITPTTAKFKLARMTVDTEMRRLNYNIYNKEFVVRVICEDHPLFRTKTSFI